MTGHTPWSAVINLGNSLIGVSILAMPFCFKECGLILGCLLLFLGSKLNRYSCHLLLRASKVTRRNSYEMLAYHTLGAVGKLAVEMCIIGYLMACCVAYFIIMGDLGPAIISKWFGLENDDRLRAGFLVFLAMFIILPLCQKRNLDGISNISVISIVFYLLFALDLIIDCIPTLLAGEWINSITLWDTSGLLRGISIFSAAFSCQTVLFAVYETVRERSPKVMEDVVDKAVSFVWLVYFAVGFFGYVLYHNPGSPKGDILLDFKPSFMSEILRLGFSFSVALSFPLAVFPCRASIYTLFFSSSHSLENPHGGSGGGAEFIPPAKFRFITFLIVIATLILGITIPNVETMLGINGAVLGNLTCFIFPALIVLKLQNMPGRNFSKVLLIVGILLMTMATYNNMQKAMEVNTELKPYKDKAVNILEDNFNDLEEKRNLGDDQGLDKVRQRIDEARKIVDELKENEPAADSKEAKKEELAIRSNERQEPAIPQEPAEHPQDDRIEEEAAKEKEVQIDLGEKEGNGDKEKDKDLELDKRKADVEEDEADKEDNVKKDLGGADDEKPAERQEPIKEDAAPVEDQEQEPDREREGGKEDQEGEKDREPEGGKEDQEGGQEVELEKRGLALEGDDEKRHKKEAKVIQKQSKKIKELEEMQKKHAEVIENQANALDFLLKKQQEEEAAEPALNQQQGGAAPDQGVVQPGGAMNEQMAAVQQQQQQQQQQQPVVQNQQPVLQDQLPVLQNQQPVAQDQQPVVQNMLPVVQNMPPVVQNMAPVVQNMAPVVQNMQPVLQNQPQMLADQQAVLQGQPALLPNQQPIVRNQQNQQPILQNQQPILQNQQPGLQNQQPVLQNQQPVLQNQQPILQNQQPVLQNQILGQDQQLLMQDQQLLQNQGQLLQNQGQGQLMQNQQPILPNIALQDQQAILQNQQPLQDQQPLVQNQQPLVQNQQPLVQNQQPLVQNQQPLGQNQQPLGQNQLGVDLNQQQVPQQQLLPQQGEGVVAHQGAQGGFPQVPPIQNDAGLAPGQGDVPMAQQAAVPQNPQPVLQMNQQQLPQQQLPQQPLLQQQLQQQQQQQVFVQQPEQQPLHAQQVPLDQQAQPIQHQIEAGANIQPMAQQANLQPMQLEVAQEGFHVPAGDNLNGFDQNLVNLPDKLEIEKRGIDIAMAANQRALQSHQYEGASKDTEDKVGAGDGGEAGEEREQAEGQETGREEEGDGDDRGGEGGLSAGMDEEGEDIVKHEQLESENGKDWEEGEVEGKSKHHGKKKEDIPEIDL